MRLPFFPGALFCCLALAAWPTSSPAQNPCPNIDFEQGDFTNWQGQIGSCCPINASPSAIVPGRHTIMTGPATDVNACNAIPVTYPGSGSFSARLGNQSTGAQAERLSYTFTVPSNSLFIYRYAVVLEDPSHQPAQQPRFEIRVLDNLGNLIDPICGYYSVVASASIPGFQSCGTVRYKNWTTVGIDLSAYVGQNVTIEFSTGDCGAGAHFGYAYLDAACTSLQITSSFCANSNTSAVLTAPDGFSYLWSTGETTRSITVVNPLPGANYSVTITSVTGCTAVLTTQLTSTIVRAGFSIASACSKEVIFTDTSTTNQSSITAWQWDFGDGTQSTDQHPHHTYAAGGFYPVTLVVLTPEGCSDTLHRTVEVLPSPVASFSLQNGCTGQPVTLNSTSSVAAGSITETRWNIGNGNILNAPSTTYTFGTTGTYPVFLAVTASNGCSDSLGTTIDVMDYPVTGFATADTLGCNPMYVQFSDLSTQTGSSTLSWSWDFGDGSQSTQQHPLHLYPLPGFFDVTLTVQNDHGCSTTLSRPQYVSVVQRPLAAFTATPQPATIAYPTIGFENASRFSSGWWWDFGDSTSISAYNTTHTYAATGTYVVNLVASNDLGCTDTTAREVMILPELLVYAPNAFTPNGDGRNDEFYLSAMSASEYYFAIFNRWGRIVFESHTPGEPWNGRFRSSGEASPAGIYYWVAEAKDPMGTHQKYKGVISLIR